jgi:hypothetical protein
MNTKSRTKGTPSLKPGSEWNSKTGRNWEPREADGSVVVKKWVDAGAVARRSSHAIDKRVR